MNRGEAMDAIMESRASGPQKLILLEYLRRQTSDEDPRKGVSWPGLSRLSDAAGVARSTAQQWRALLVEAGVLIVVSSPRGAPPRMRVSFTGLAAYRAPKSLPRDRATAAEGVPESGTVPQRGIPQRKPGCTAARTGGVPQRGTEPSPVEPSPENPTRARDPLAVAWQAMETSRAGALGGIPTPWPAVESLARGFIDRFGVDSLHLVCRYWAAGEGFWPEVLRGQRAYGKAGAAPRDWHYVLGRLSPEAQAEIVAQAAAGTTKAPVSEQECEKAFFRLRNQLRGVLPTDEIPPHWLDSLGPLPRHCASVVPPAAIRDGAPLEVYEQQWLPAWQDAMARGAA